MAVCSSETQPSRATNLGAYATALGSLDSTPEDPAPVPQTTLRRQNPRQEPSAVVPLARIRAGDSPSPKPNGQGLSLPQSPGRARSQ
jgi:hypothetical protein